MEIKLARAISPKNARLLVDEITAQCLTLSSEGKCKKEGQRYVHTAASGTKTIVTFPQFDTCQVLDETGQYKVTINRGTGQVTVSARGSIPENVILPELWWELWEQWEQEIS